MTEKEFSKHIAQLISTICEKSDKYELTLKADTHGVYAELSVLHPHLDCINKVSTYRFFSTESRSEANKHNEMLLIARLSGAPLEYVPSIHGEWKEGMKL
jgi:hypothetical protein